VEPCEPMVDAGIFHGPLMRGAAIASTAIGAELVQPVADSLAALLDDPAFELARHGSAYPQ
jgi:hypothetical protein